MRSSALAILGFAVALSCSSEEGLRTQTSQNQPVASNPTQPSAAGSAAAPAPSGPDPFTYATVKESAEPAPARFSAPVPAIAGYAEWPQSAPSPGHVGALLCAGDAKMRESFLAGLTAAAAKARSLDELQRYGGIAGNCDDEEARCAWVATVVKSTRPVLVRQTVWSALRDCPSEYDETIDGADAPLDVVRDHARYSAIFVAPGRKATRRPWKRLVAGARASEKDVGMLVTVLQGLSMAGDDSARDFVIKRHGEVKGAVKTAYGHAACGWRDFEAADKICADTCAKLKDSACEPEQPRAKVSWPADLNAAACDPDDESFSTLKDDYPARIKEIGSAAGACLQSAKVKDLLADKVGQNVVSYHLTLLAETDYATGHTIAKALRPSVDALERTNLAVRELQKQVAFLALAPSREVALDTLKTMGFTIPTSPKKGGGTWTTFQDILADSGAVVQFDPETGQWPNEHDDLARQLSRPIAKAMSGVLFEELATEANDTEAYALRAYFDGVRFEVNPEALGDWYDVHAVIGLVNSVLRKRGAAERVALIFGWGNDAGVLAANGDAIRRAQAAGLLDILDGGKSVDDAREMEQKAIEKFRGTPSDD